MILSLFAAIPLFTSGTDLIEAGEYERGETTLQALLSTSISEETKNRALYNLGVAALDQSKWEEALSYFQQVEGTSSDLQPFIQEGIKIALKSKPHGTLTPFLDLPSPLTLQAMPKEMISLLRHMASLPYEGGENEKEYKIIQNRLSTILNKKSQWWNSVIIKQEEMSPKGCFQEHWEEVVQRLSEATRSLEKANQGFTEGAKPYAVIYPLLQDAFVHLQMVDKALAEKQKEGEKEPEQTERFQTLSEMYRKDEPAPAPIPKGALW